MTEINVTDMPLALTDLERQTLLFVLEQALEEGRMERRRTEGFQAQEVVQEHQQVLQSLLDKVRRLPGTAL